MFVTNSTGGTITSLDVRRRWPLSEGNAYQSGGDLLGMADPASISAAGGAYKTSRAQTGGGQRVYISGQ